MPWGRIDDTWYDHPKLEGIAGEGTWPDRLAAAGLNSLAWSWCNRFLTDGHVPRRTVEKLGGTHALAEILVAAGLWETAASGYQIHDFLVYNDSRAAVLARREKESRRKADWRARTRPDGSPTGTANGGSENVPPSVPTGHEPQMSRRDTRARVRSANPDPTRPVPTESGTSTLGGARGNGAEPLLSAKELDAWRPYGRRQWDDFKAAWLARGFKLPPAADPDDPRSQAHVVWEILDNRPTDLVAWVKAAPGKTSHQVVAHLIERWQALKAELGADEETAAPDWLPSKAEATEALGAIMGRLAGEKP